MRKRKVWGIWTAIRVNSNAKWRRWYGPMGVYGIALVPNDIKDIFGGSPFFFRTRKQARDCAIKKETESNRTWTWVKHQVRPVILSWEDVK